MSNNILRRAVKTTAEVATVVVAGGAQVVNVYNDGWDAVKNNNAWVKRNAEAEFKQAYQYDRVKADNDRVGEWTKDQWSKVSDVFGDSKTEDAPAA